jgi:ketosteroid isomerase-like protein
MTNEGKAVRAIIENWARAVESGDRKGILANHADDFLMFDFPDVVRGIKAYDKTWDFFFDKPKGPIHYEPRDLAVTAGDQVAFATCLVHCDGTSAGTLDFRLTTGLKKVGSAWTIVHEHHSVPTIEERFIGPGSK